MDALGSVVDPSDVRWIWLTHPDRDHTGALFDLLEAAPQARLITTFLGAGIMSTERPLPMDRVYLLNPGQSLDVGDRTLRPSVRRCSTTPRRSASTTTGPGTCFSSDCFGAPMPSAELAGCSDVRDVPRDELRAGQLLWATVDSPWVHTADPTRYLGTVEPLRAMDPAVILSTHLPPAAGQTSSSLTCSQRHRAPIPSSAPTSSALEEMLAGFEPATT